MNSLLGVIPGEIVLSILCEWLDDSAKDFCSLDAALTNKGLRNYFLVLCSQDTKLMKRGLGKLIEINSDTQYTKLVNWKEKRGLDIAMIRLKNLIGFAQCVSELKSCFSSLKEIEMIGCDVKLLDIFGGDLRNLQSLTIKNCMIVVTGDKETLLTNPLIPTNINKLILGNISDCYFNDIGNEFKATTLDYDIIYLWIAKCCPQVEIGNILECLNWDFVTALCMLHLWPKLTNFHYKMLCVDIDLQGMDMETYHAQRESVKSWVNAGSNTFVKFSMKELTLDSTFDKLYVWSTDSLLSFLCVACDMQYLEHLNLSIDDITSQRKETFLQKIQLGHLIDLTLHSYGKSDLNPYLTEVLQYCTKLESLCISGHKNGRGLSLNDKTCFYFTQSSVTNQNQFFLPSLHSLVLDAVILTEEQMIAICQSPLAKQLTTLKLRNFDCFSSPSVYECIVKSFTQLQVLELTIEFVFDLSQTAPVKAALVQFLDCLFSGNFSSGQTLTSLKIEVPFAEFPVCLEAISTEIILHDHVKPHWHFHFPNLINLWISFSINDLQISHLLMKRVLYNCPKLHSLRLYLIHGAPAFSYINQAELIRQLREGCPFAS